MKSLILATIALASTSGIACAQAAPGSATPIGVALRAIAAEKPNQQAPLSDAALSQVTGGVGYDLTSGYGTVTALQGPAADHVSSLHPFTAGTNVPAQAAASYYNPSFVADGQYTAGLSPYGNGNPAPNVGNH